MAVFWFGWAKKLKNIFTKQQADTYYLQKELPNQLQVVKGNVDFYKNIVVKQNGYVDRVDTNAPTSMINKRYLEEQTLSKTSTSAQTVAGPVNLRSSIELGTEIKAGYGGGSVKFIPEDNSTKTLQFYNANPNDTRRFNLLVPNPTAAQNPATKQYVDNQIQQQSTTLNTNINNLNTNINNLNTNINNLIKKTDYSWGTINGPFNSGNTTYYRFTLNFSQPLAVIGVNVNYKDQTSFLEKSAYWRTSWAVAGSNNVSVLLFMDKNMYSDKGGTSLNIDPAKFVIRVFYIDRYNSRQNEGDIIILETGGVK